MGIKSLLSINAYVMLNKKLIMEVGLIPAAVVGFLSDKHEMLKKAGALGEDGFFFYTAEEMKEQTSLSRYEQDKAIEALVSKGIVEVRKAGLPARRHFRIVDEKLLEIFGINTANVQQTSFQKTSKLDAKKLGNINKNNNINNPLEESIFVSKDTHISSSSPCSDFSQNRGGKTEKIDYQFFLESFNRICKSFPRLTKLSEQRKATIRSRLKEYSQEEILEAFDRAEQSDFLSGRDGGWDKCCFDWIMQPRNILKILEGNYTNRDSEYSPSRGIRPPTPEELEEERRRAELARKREEEEEAERRRGEENRRIREEVIREIAERNRRDEQS